MAKYLLTLLTLFASFSSMALEIQCKSSIEDLDIVVIRSPKTQTLYLVALKGDVANPISLDGSLFKDNADGVSYGDDRLSFTIEKQSGTGEVIITGSNPLSLSSCQFL